MTARCSRSRPMPRLRFPLRRRRRQVPPYRRRRSGNRSRRLRLQMGRACGESRRRQGRGPARLRGRRGRPIYSTRPARAEELAHPSSVTGLVFDAKGEAHRGVALQRRDAVVRCGQDRQPAPAGMEGQPHGDCDSSRGRRGGHGDARECAAWLAVVGRPAHAHERLSGEDGALSFSRTGKWLATSGADTMVLWPFFGGGPMGKAPMNSRAATNHLLPGRLPSAAGDAAGGFADGLVVLADVN